MNPISYEDILFMISEIKRGVTYEIKEKYVGDGAHPSVLSQRNYDENVTHDG